MLTSKNQQINSVFERIIRDKNGVLVRVRFAVIEINGKFAPQIISVTPILAPKTEKVVCLPRIKEGKVVVEDATPSFISKISPYFSLDFFMSQPTRAPSFE